MKLMGGILAVIALFLISIISGRSYVHAASGSLVIAEVQLGASGASKHEFVLIHNNSTQDVNVTDWCVVYSGYTDETRTTLRCFTKPEGVDEVRVAGGGNILLASQTFPLTAGVRVAERFAGSTTDMSGARGHVRILNASAVEVDKLAWDNKVSTPPVSPEFAAAIAPATGKSIARVTVDGVLVDTDNNLADFHEQTPLPLNSELYEYIAPVPIIDLCQLDGVQEVMPNGYGYDEAGNCELLASDVCLNLEKIQVTVPDGMAIDGSECFADVCMNLLGLQTTVPAGYVQNEGTCTKLEDRALMITELLANASGTDTGQEFVELYNPHDESVSLAGYLLAVGKTFEKTYSLLSAGQEVLIAPHSYHVLRDDDLGFTLLNTTSGVRLLAPAGNIVSEVTYDNPKDDMSWVLLDDVWSYSNVPTPGSPNQASVEADTETPLSVVSPTPCSEGKYRHPLTNRCRNIETDASVIASCDADEYRNPDTNRCRKLATLATATLAACEDGYERNNETNRCRKVAGVATTLKECEPGYERNPETNRCRAVASAATTNAKSLTETKDSPSGLNWPAVGAISTIAVGYALYEWRREFAKGMQAVGSRFRR